MSTGLWRKRARHARPSLAPEIQGRSEAGWACAEAQTSNKSPLAVSRTRPRDGSLLKPQLPAIRVPRLRPAPRPVTGPGRARVAGGRGLRHAADRAAAVSLDDRTRYPGCAGLSVRILTPRRAPRPAEGHR